MLLRLKVEDHAGRVGGNIASCLLLMKGCCLKESTIIPKLENLTVAHSLECGCWNRNSHKDNVPYQNENVAAVLLQYKLVARKVRFLKLQYRHNILPEALYFCKGYFFSVKIPIKWATLWEKNCIAYAKNKGSGEPAHLCSLTSPLLFITKTCLFKYMEKFHLQKLKIFR